MEGFMVACIGVLLIFFAVIFTEYQRGVQEYKFVEYDYKLLTSADYTVEFTVTPSMWQVFLDNQFDENNPISEIGQFRLYVIYEFEERLKNLPAVYPEIYPDDDDKPYQPKVAMVNFAYNNSQIIELLKERGSYVKNESWPELKKIN